MEGMKGGGPEVGGNRNSFHFAKSQLFWGNCTGFHFAFWGKFPTTRPVSTG
jgi:hypothetical protein